MIYLMYATIRMNTCFENIKHWYDTAIDRDNVKIKVAVNTNNEKEMLLSLSKESVINDCIDIIVTESPKIGYCYSMNYLTKQLELQDDDILIFLADDIYSPHGWDKYIRKEFSDFDNCLMLDDGFQLTDTRAKNVMPSLNIPAMKFSCLKQIGKKLFSEEYTHFFADNELYYNMVDLALLRDKRQAPDSIVFEHRHYWINGKRPKDEFDDEYIKNASKDKEVFDRRIKLTVGERIRT